jgi:hypothetical protein
VADDFAVLPPLARRLSHARHAVTAEAAAAAAAWLLPPPLTALGWPCRIVPRYVTLVITSVTYRSAVLSSPRIPWSRRGAGVPPRTPPSVVRVHTVAALIFRDDHCQLRCRCCCRCCCRSMESADSGPRIAAGAWGQHHGRLAPSFWCRMLSSSPSSTKFLLARA